MTCISTIPHDHLAALMHPHEPMCFTTCDGPHSGVADDRRPPHRDDFDGSGWKVRNYRRNQPPVSHFVDEWTGFGFTAADFAAWTSAGIYEPAVAAECRTAGFDPSCEVDRRFLLSDDPETWRPFCDLLCDSDMTAEQAWRAWKAAP